MWAVEHAPVAKQSNTDTGSLPLAYLGPQLDEQRLNIATIA